MTKKYGVSSTGLIAPIIRKGDDLAEIVTNVVLDAIDNIEDGDVIGITESIVARAQGNYVTVDEVAEDIKKVIKNTFEKESKYVKNIVKNPLDSIVLYWPIYSRNRFAMILKAFARAANKTVKLYMPDIDEVGNVLHNHPFTNLNYDEYYKSIVEAEGKECIIKTSPLEVIISEGDIIIDCRLHLPEIAVENNQHLTLRDFCKDKCEYGLLGSNKASEEKLKLFPSKKYSQELVEEIKSNIYKETGKKVEVMVYGDGCFKDPVGGIWEFADPITSPAYTKGLEGTPNELKLKNIADEKYANLSGKELEKAIKSDIRSKDNNLKGNMTSQGTTPRRYVDLLASLMDLTSGSGDKGTPIVYVKRYFENYGFEEIK